MQAGVYVRARYLTLYGLETRNMDVLLLMLKECSFNKMYPKVQAKHCASFVNYHLIAFCLVSPVLSFFYRENKTLAKAQSFY